MQHELCERIAHTLATAPVHDHLGYEALAHLKLPGPSYLLALNALHRVMNPKLYVEIGTRDGQSLKLAGADTRCVAIDPNPQFPQTQAPEGQPQHPWDSKHVMLAVCTSDVFFDREENREKTRGFDLAFIDGDHSFAQAYRDFANLERLSKPSSIIAIHDVIPMDARTAQAKPDGVSFWTGDVWRLMAAIVANRPDLIAFTLACPPTGLGIIGKLNGGTPGLSQAAIGAAELLPFPLGWYQQRKMLNIIPNDGAAFVAALKGEA